MLGSVSTLLFNSRNGMAQGSERVHIQCWVGSPITPLQLVYISVVMIYSYMDAVMCTFIGLGITD